MVDMDTKESPRFTSEGKLIRTDIWRKGEYIDLWSVAHMISGTALGFYPRYLHLDIFAAFAIVFALLVAYEVFELVVRIKETFWNHTTDVLFGLVGFTPAYFFSSQLVGTTSLVACGIATIVALAASGIGWSYSYKTFKLEKKFSAQREHV